MLNRIGRVFAGAFEAERPRSVDEALRDWRRARCPLNGRRPDELSWHRADFGLPETAGHRGSAS